MFPQRLCDIRQLSIPHLALSSSPTNLNTPEHNAFLPASAANRTKFEYSTNANQQDRTL
jgi:hypothetical protein